MTTQCYICKARTARLKARPNNFFVNKCSVCGLISAEGINQEAVKSFYDKRYFSSDNSNMGYKNYIADEANHRKNARHILRETDKIASLGNARVLDIGCAFGFLLDEAKKFNVNGLYGVEISGPAREYAHDTLGLENIAANDTLQNFESNYFNAVFMIGTIEHLTHPKEMMVNVNRILKRGGLITITTVDTKGMIPLYSIKPPEHIFYFNHANLSLFLKESGFEQLVNKTYWASYAFHDLLYRLGEFLSMPFIRGISGFFKKNASFSVKIPTNEMFVIARKV